MAVDLAALVQPWRTAVVTSEMQNGVVGEDAILPELAEVARGGMIPALARLVKSARAAGVRRRPRHVTNAGWTARAAT